MEAAGSNADEHLEGDIHVRPGRRAGRGGQMEGPRGVISGVAAVVNT